MTLVGKGFYVWKIPYCEGGDPAAIASVAATDGLTHVLLKVADGVYSYNIDANGVDLVPPVVDALTGRGVTAWGWHYLYGDNPIGEANKAIQRIGQTGISGYVLDVEVEYKEPGKDAAAVLFMNTLRSAYPNLPVALSSYRYPSYHPQIPWEEFLSGCDINMPQVYWQEAHNPADQLLRCVREFESIVPYRPIIPTGSAYKVGTWAPTVADINEFLQAVRDLNLSAANFWEWAHTRTYLPELWQAIKDFVWDTPPPPQDITQRYIAALNSHDPNQVAALYMAQAVHITSARTIQGLLAIRAWYQTLFTQLLPNATFTLTGYTGTGSSRHFTWTAASDAGTVSNGNDTFGLVEDQITYHYSFFRIS